MCKVIEDMKNKAIREKALSIARKLLVLNRLTYEEIADAVGLSVNDVKALDREKFSGSSSRLSCCSCSGSGKRVGSSSLIVSTV